MKRFLEIAVIAALSVMMASCTYSRIGDIALRQYRVISIEPQGLRSVDGAVSLEIENNGPTLTFPTLEGEIFRNGSRIGTFSLSEPLVLPGPKTSWTDLHARINLDPDISIFAIMGMFRRFDVSLYSVSFDTRVRLGKLSKRIRRERIPLEKFIPKKK